MANAEQTEPAGVAVRTADAPEPSVPSASPGGLEPAPPSDSAGTVVAQPGGAVAGPNVTLPDKPAGPGAAVAPGVCAPVTSA